jgi:putative membrane protein
MRIAAIILTVLVAALHFGFMGLEMFYWTEPLGMRVFNMTPEGARTSAVLAANQGLYNGLFAVGLLWALFTRRDDTLMFLLGCIIVAGIYGGLTAKPTIVLVQALPALLALLATWMSQRST